MVQDGVSRRMKTLRRMALATMAALPLIGPAAPEVHAQNMMRSPNLNLNSRVPTFNPNIGGRIGAGVLLERATPRIGIVRSPCGDAYRDNDDQCRDQPVKSVDGGGAGGSQSKIKNSGPRRNNLPVAGLVVSAVPDQLVAELDGSLSDARIVELARRRGLVLLGSQKFPLIDATIGLFRITGQRPADAVRRDFATDAGIRNVQFNLHYRLQDQVAVPTEGDPAQYALAMLRLPQAHTLAHGANVTIAVIDSGVDISHPELANSIGDSFDALGSKEGPHAHGTGVAGAIVSHARLMGGAPEARILAIRAFGATGGGAAGTSFVILKGLDYAAAHGAQIINMSFAGPKDALIERGIAALAARGIVMVAASGNAGPKSPPLYPAAYANVIAVSATDAREKLFSASNRGSHIALSAPGADIFLPAPDAKYQMASGTSFSAAYISGVAALVLERNPALKPEDVRAILMRTARDLGAPGRDDLFGAGEADAFSAVQAAIAAPAVPVATLSNKSTTGKVESPDVPAARDLSQPPAAMASDRPAGAASGRPAAQ